MVKYILGLIIIAVAIIGILKLRTPNDNMSATSAPKPSQSPTITPLPTVSLRPSVAPVKKSPTPIKTPILTKTPTPTPTPTLTISPTPTAIPTSSPSPSATPVPTATSTPSTIEPSLQSISPTSVRLQPQLIELRGINFGTSDNRQVKTIKIGDNDVTGRIVNYNNTVIIISVNYISTGTYDVTIISQDGTSSKLTAVLAVSP